MENVTDLGAVGDYYQWLFKVTVLAGTVFNLNNCSSSVLHAEKRQGSS